MKDFMPVDSATSDKFFITYSDTVYHYFYEGFIANTSSSYALVCARVLGMDYIEYLRMARDKYNAVLRGKKGFPLCYFDNKKDADALCKVLQTAWAHRKV